MDSPRQPFLIVGIGNEYRADDSIGIRIAARIKKTDLSQVEIIEGISDGTSLIALWQGRKKVWIIDCVMSGNSPGKIFRFEALHEPIPEKLFGKLSTHAFSLTEAIELGRTLNQLPREIIVYGIEGRNIQTGGEITPDVRDAVEVVFERIMAELKNSGQ